VFGPRSRSQQGDLRPTLHPAKERVQCGFVTGLDPSAEVRLSNGLKESAGGASDAE
jgi:hypothetical protein